MNLSRVRWALATLLALIGLISAINALRTYIAHGQVLGVLAVLTLALITVGGMVSLAMARKRIGEELLALNAPSPAGSLLAQRQQRLEAIKATGARPDLSALADATAAQEASRAYFGRYLVATTVLVGLVGTFAGLMETLGKVAPLLSDEGAGALALLAGPLAGLHVTFGASLVAIVVTLALSLAQGDLVLHEEQALATLEDLTHHQLVPALWPPHGDANERTVRLLEGLSQHMAQAVVGALKEATETLNRSQDERFKELVTQLAASARDTTVAISTHTTQTATALASTSSQVEARLQNLIATVSDKLTENTQQQVLQVSQAVAHVSERLGKGADNLMDAWQRQMAETAKAVAANAEDVIAQSALLAEQMSAQLKDTLDKAGRALADSAADTAVVLKQTAEHSENQTRTLGDEWLRSAQDMKQALETTAQTSVNHTAAAVAQSAQALVDTLAPLFASETQERKVLVQALEKNLNSVGDWLSRVDQQTQTLEAQAQQHAQALQTQAQNHVLALTTSLSETAGQVVKSLADMGLRNGDSLQAAADKLLQGAQALEQTLTPLQPLLTSLAAELERLTHELAVMAAHADTAHSSAVVLAELERVGDGLERLASLVRLAREPETPELQEAHS